jgi:uncharacterized OB-fold protein
MKEEDYYRIHKAQKMTDKKCPQCGSKMYKVRCSSGSSEVYYQWECYGRKYDCPYIEKVP